MSPVVGIETIAAGGDGVGRLSDGMAVFVPRTAPGDRAEVDILRRKQRYAQGRLVRLTRHSPDRIEPRCNHYRVDECGGCQLQHMALSGQLEAKRRLVGDALRRIGKLEVSDPPIAPSATEWRYRTRVKLAAVRDRIGLRKYGRPDSVFPLDDCLIVRESVMTLWTAVMRERALLPAWLEALVLREDTEGRYHLVVLGGDTPWDAGSLGAALGNASPSIWWQPRRGAARVLEGPKTGFPATAFEQVCPENAGRLRTAAVAAAGDMDGAVVWDLYGGVGATADLMAERGARVWSVERDRNAVEWGKRHGSKAVTRIAGLVEESLGRLPEPTVVLLNPPRAGVARHVTRWMETWAAGPGRRRVVYVSCDPATLARDLARLPSFRIERVEAYDIFPQTAHVETVVTMEAS